jgi:hypothetical protein
MPALKTAAVLFVLLAAAPAMADHTTQRPIQECVVIHQVGMVHNATPADLAQGMTVPCNLNDDDAVRYYFRKLHEREDEFCPRCCCGPGWEKR